MGDTEEVVAGCLIGLDGSGLEKKSSSKPTAGRFGSGGAACGMPKASSKSASKEGFAAAFVAESCDGAAEVGGAPVCWENVCLSKPKSSSNASSNPAEAAVTGMALVGADVLGVASGTLSTRAGARSSKSSKSSIAFDVVAGASSVCAT